MNFGQVVLDVIEKLNQSNISYMLTGALAVNYYGEPRTTHDIDLVLEITENDASTLVEFFEKDFFIDNESIQIALHERSMFNIIHKEIGLKVDFWILGNDEFTCKEFGQRVKVKAIGTEMWLPKAEDVIIRKLDWYKNSDIDKHYLDALGIYRIQKENLDIKYITNWVTKKSTLKIWQKIQEAL
ncbi:hypothetical protein KAW65_02745 [candidate division WOR-3 bacterium]|nr:hypothetical protein [candidate division WOR-3 bacterium]